MTAPQAAAISRHGYSVTGYHTAGMTQNTPVATSECVTIALLTDPLRRDPARTAESIHKAAKNHS